MEKPKPYVLQTLPPSGSLPPGEKTNIRIMFTPLEEVRRGKWPKTNIRIMFTPLEKGRRDRLPALAFTDVKI